MVRPLRLLVPMLVLPAYSCDRVLCWFASLYVPEADGAGTGAGTEAGSASVGTGWMIVFIRLLASLFVGLLVRETVLEPMLRLLVVALVPAGQS